jgi:hypothetical protein
MGRSDNLTSTALKLVEELYWCGIKENRDGWDNIEPGKEEKFYRKKFHQANLIVQVKPISNQISRQSLERATTTEINWHLWQRRNLVGCKSNHYRSLVHCHVYTGLKRVLL